MSDKYVSCAMLDADMIRAHEAGDDLSRFPLYHAPGIPTFYGALEIAHLLHVETVDTQTKRTRINRDTFPKVAYTAVVQVRYQSSVKVGAGMSQSEAVAIGLAFRAAIQNLLTG